MDPTTVTQQLAKQTDTGSAAIILLFLVLCVLCWPHIVNGIARLRGKKTVSVEGDVHTVPRPEYVPTDVFNERMKKVDGDIAVVRGEVSALRSDITNGNIAVLNKLDELDKRSEDRAIALNRRMDPLIEKVAKNSEAVDFLKAASLNKIPALNPTIGAEK